MGASSSTLAQGEDPLIREFWQMLGRLNLDDEVQPASSTRLPCGDKIAASHAEWQRDSDEQIEGVIVSFFIYFPLLSSPWLRRSPWPPGSRPHQPRSSGLSHFCHPSQLPEYDTDNSCSRRQARKKEPKPWRRWPRPLSASECWTSPTTCLPSLTAAWAPPPRPAKATRLQRRRRKPFGTT